MPNIDPKVIFWLSVAIAIAGVGSQAALWGGALPADWIPILTAWNHILSTVGQVVMPLLLGQQTTISSRIANAAAVDGVKGLQVDPKIADVAAQAAGDNATVIPFRKAA